VREGRTIIQDFRPLAESLDWELGQLYWNEQGSRAFLSGDVPYLINNDGVLSWNAAEVFFESLVAADREGRLEPRILALEVGVGLGLFARFFLDVFRYLCLTENKDYYARLVYVAADRSPQMLSDLEKHEIFRNHPSRYELLRFDALDPLPAAGPAGGEQGAALGPFRAIFLNYALDPLPASVLKFDASRVTQLHIRTLLNRGLDLQDHTDLTAEEILLCAAAADNRERGRLIGLYPVFALEQEYRPVDLDELPYGAVAARFAAATASLTETDARHLLHNHGALRCLDRLLGVLHDEGFVLINDYDESLARSPDDALRHQRFGGSTAVSLNVPLLKFCFQTCGGLDWVEPAEDDGQICTRMFGRRISAPAAARFHEVFGKAAYERRHRPVEEARARAAEGRHEAAMDAYRTALERQPNNWRLMGEVAQYLTLQLREHAAGLEMARAALALNPIGPDLWNTLGDSLFCLDRAEEAHDALLRAVALNPSDVRARYNLAFTFGRRRDYLSALRMIAEGLAHDRAGQFRERLLAKQTEILGLITTRNRQSLQGIANRFSWSARRNVEPPST
jgi:tetratricopeptide (TPR) repeat protein